MQVELAVATSQKEDALQTAHAQGIELQQKIEQVEALTAIIKRLQLPDGTAQVLEVSEDMKTFAKRLRLLDGTARRKVKIRYPL